MKSEYENLQKALVALNELKNRATRLECRLVQLGDHVGANLRERMRTEVKTDAQGDLYVEVDAIDVSMSRVVTTLREHGIKTGDIPVVLKGQRICVVYPART